MEQLSPSFKPGMHKNTQAEDDKMSTKLTEDQGNQGDKEHEFTTPQAPATLQEGEEFVTNTNTTASKSQSPPVHMPPFMNEEGVPVTTEDTGDDIPNKTEEEQDKNTSSIGGSVVNNSREEPKIIATLTSSSFTVNEATQEALSVSSESTKAEEAVVSGGSTSEVLLEPSKGVGFATPVLESSMQEILTHDSTSSSEWDGLHHAATSARSPTSVLPSSLPSSSGEILSGATNSSSAQDKLKQNTGKSKM
jgi:hypothetical protein